ncbi:hypothetical protein ACEPAH_5842 [Sanghuangporus vaninii]
MRTSMVLLRLLEALREHTPTMPVCAGPPYPSLSYRTADRPAVYGFVSHHVNDVRQQVYTELRAERARAPDAQRSYHSPYAYSSGHSRLHYAPHADMHNRRDNTSTTRSRLAFPTPQVPSFSVGPSPADTGRQERSHTLPDRQVRFQSPHSYDPYTPASSYPTATSASTARPMRMPEPQPYPVDPLPISMPTQRIYQSQAQGMLFPGSSHSRPLPPTPYLQPSSGSVFESSTACTYGSPYGSSSRSSSSRNSSRTSRTMYPHHPNRPTPSVFGSSASSTYGDSSYRSSSSYNSRRRGKDTTIALRKALEKMQDFKRVADDWILIIRRYRGEKLTAEETAVISLISDLRQRAKTALNTINIILASISAYEGIGNGSPFSSEKLKADTSALAMIGTSLHHKLAGLTQRLKNAEAMAGQTEPPSSPDCCTRLMNFPGCIASFYLKKRLFRFTSLLKSQSEQYSDLDSEKPVQSGSYAPPISTLIGAVYAEIQRTYNTATKALAGFESSLRTFQLDLQSQANNRYLPVATG